jgi:hypothetical protein
MREGLRRPPPSSDTEHIGEGLVRNVGPSRTSSVRLPSSARPDLNGLPGGRAADVVIRLLKQHRAAEQAPAGAATPLA